VVAGEPQVDYPVGTTALSLLPLGRDELLNSRVRRASENYLYISPPKTGGGQPVRFVERDLFELSWQADDGLRSVSAVAVAETDDDAWRLRIAGPARHLQRRATVRAPIGLSVSLSWDETVLMGSTVDLSEGGVLCVFRPNGDLGVHVPYPKRDQPLRLRLDLHSDALVTEVALVARRPREDKLHEWSLRYLSLPNPAAELIRSHVSTALANARARGLTKLY
jgi:hypothetical protein